MVFNSRLSRHNEDGGFIQKNFFKEKLHENPIHIWVQRFISIVPGTWEAEIGLFKASLSNIVSNSVCSCMCLYIQFM
jgi:hypothetical protein